ncbi:MAG: PD-(D/E)XK nuclease family protein [Bacteroidales bacterium]|nr:PD-(D/E)XK nuclease family protein [Bacteroidales bacterium]
MKQFLKQVAEHYYDLGDISRRCFVFPNRRSMVFFSKYLCDAVKGNAPIIAPQMLTINDLFYKVAGLFASDRVRLLLELYECYKSLNHKAETLDEFVFWGDVILSDFNDVDKYLVNPSQLFTNVADYKALQDTFEYLTPNQKTAIESFIEHFNDKSGRLTVDLDSDNPDVKGRFLQIWNILNPLYESFRETLRSKGMAYEGMVYRDLSDRLKTESVADVFNAVFNEGTEFVFVGLNALSESEKMLLRKLRDAGRAQFCWDWSGDLIRDPQNRSSFFMAENVLEFPQASEWDAEGVSIPQINVVSVSSMIGQAKRLPDILGDIALERYSGDISLIGADCAVVLPDENLLRPVLNSIPEPVKDINVTMGLPMSGSLLFVLMSDISSAQLNVVRKNGKSFFYHKQVWDIFSSEVFRKIADDQTLERVADIRREAKHYIPEDDFTQEPLLAAIFRPVLMDTKSPSSEQIRSFADYQKEVLRALASKIADDGALAVELEFAREYYRCVNVLQEIELEVLPVTYVRLLSQLLGSVSVPFKGEPLRGLQIMGPLEMRALDFKDLIIMSANEGTFPRRNVSSSFIPPELRKGFGMPTYEYQDAVWAYYFYRMISRAENVWMLVDSRTEGLKSGEESRYIKQLEYHFGLPLKRYVVKYDSMKTAQLAEVQKTEEDVKKIKETALSATTVQNYLACPAKFYYSTVVGLRAEEEVTESLDYGMFGTIFHETMRSLYTGEDSMSGNEPVGQPLKIVSADYLKSWLSRESEIRAKVKSLIMREMNVLEVSGRNLVVADVIVKYVKKTLNCDLDILRENGAPHFVMLGLENKVTRTIAGQKFKGYIDRLDSVNDGEVRVVDYKTGKVLENDENIDDDNAVDIADMIFDPTAKERPKIALQFFIYDMLIQGDPRVQGMKIANSVYSTANLFKDNPKTRPLCTKFYDAMTEHLEKLLEEMYDTEVPFRRTDDEKVCSYCDFKMICGR